MRKHLDNLRTLKIITKRGNHLLVVLPPLPLVLVVVVVLVVFVMELDSEVFSPILELDLVTIRQVTLVILALSQVVVTLLHDVTVVVL